MSDQPWPGHPAHEAPIRSVREAFPGFTQLDQPLGELVMQFAWLEGWVGDSINTMMRLTVEEGLALSAVMPNFNMRIELFAALTEMHTAYNEILKKDATKIVSLIRQANSDRNNLIHDAWSTYYPGAETFDKARYKVENGTLRKIDHAQAIDALTVQATNTFIVTIIRALQLWLTQFRNRETPNFVFQPLPNRFFVGSPLHSRAKGRKKKGSPLPPESSPA